MRVLVTGGGGFLGRHLTRALVRRGDSVRIFQRSPVATAEAQVVCGDIADIRAVRAAVRGCDAVFHTAGKVDPYGKYAAFFRANVLGARAVADACLAEGVRALVYTSTPSVVFDGRDLVEADESTPYARRFFSAYAQTKALAERETLARAKDGLCVCALRPHLIYGRDDPHLLPAVVRRARAGKLRRVGDGRNRVSLTHIDDAVAAHLCALDALRAGRAHGKAYFIAHAAPVLLWDFIGKALESVGVAAPKKSVPYVLAYAFGALCERLTPPEKMPAMTRFVAANLARTHTFAVAAAARDLGFVARVGAEDGLREWAREFSATDRR